MEKFWIVVRQGGNGSKRLGHFKCHDDSAAAAAEANRLALKEGDDFFVFECVSQASAPEVPEPPA